MKRVQYIKCYLPLRIINITLFHREQINSKKKINTKKHARFIKIHIIIKLRPHKYNYIPSRAINSKETLETSKICRDPHRC